MSAENEFKALPVIEVKALHERIAEATQDNYSDIIQDIADLEDKIQKEILCKALSKKLEVNYRTVRNAVTAFEKDNEPVPVADFVTAVKTLRGQMLTMRGPRQ